MKKTRMKISGNRKYQEKIIELPNFCVDACSIIVALPPDVTDYEEFEIQQTMSEFNQIWSHCAAILFSVADLEKEEL